MYSHSAIKRNELLAQNKHKNLQPGLIIFYDIRPTNGSGLYSRSIRQVRKKKKTISGEAYDINKQTISIAPKTKIESRAHYVPEPARGGALQLTQPRLETTSSPGRPNHTWLRAFESDLRPLNIGPSYAWNKAASREHWRSTVDTAVLYLP